ncbi:MAG TPA: lasso peptide biosynthesis B2 protein [Acidimicrobiales bacterium]|nr:lasso peptide biosynthesis B2 protein [Acidimicrobiales bacterium]
MIEPGDAAPDVPGAKAVYKGPLRPVEKLLLFGRIWFWGAWVRVQLRRCELPDVVGRLGEVPPRAASRPVNPLRLGKIVHRASWIGPFKPRCLVIALVHFRLLREQGEAAQLVIGLPAGPQDIAAHAWVEMGGVDVGPPPGRGRHEELVRYA